MTENYFEGSTEALRRIIAGELGQTVADYGFADARNNTELVQTLGDRMRYLQGAYDAAAMLARIADRGCTWLDQIIQDRKLREGDLAKKVSSAVKSVEEPVMVVRTDHDSGHPNF